jgi:signal transduction histidine kinase
VLAQTASAPTQEKVQDRSLPHGEPAVDSARGRLTTILIDSLLHDARNPLNALSINLEVLAERIKRESGGALPAQYEKNIKTIRDQIQRVDGVMKQFADFIAPRPSGESQVDLSALVLRAVEVIGHEGRKRRVGLRPAIDAGVKLRSEGLRDAQAVHFLAVAPLVRAVARSASPSEVLVTLRRDAGAAIYRVEDTGSEAIEQPDVCRALEVLAAEHRGDAVIRGGLVEVRLPLV